MNSLLIHTCTIVTRTKTGSQDSYGQDEYGESETRHVSCRYSRAKESEITDDKGIKQRVDGKIFVGFTTAVTLMDKIKDIKDDIGVAVIAGELEVVGLVPTYDGSEGHHKEVLVRRAG